MGVTVVCACVIVYKGVNLGKVIWDRGVISRRCVGINSSPFTESNRRPKWAMCAPPPILHSLQ